MFMGIIIFLLVIYGINVGTTIWYNLETYAKVTRWNFFRIFIPGALLLQLYIEKLKSEPLRIYESRFRVGQKIKFKEIVGRDHWDSRYYNPYLSSGIGYYTRFTENTKIVKIQMIDKLNRIYYTDKGEYSFDILELGGKALKSTWIVKQRKGPKRERR